MAEYIEREDALHAILGEPTESHYPSWYAERIKTLPAADVAPVVHGRWVDRIVDENEVIQPWMKRYYCSECLEGGSQSWFKFCPNCGSKMDGGAINND